MKLSNERKFFVGLLILSLGAVIVDRVVLQSEMTAPRQAEALLVPARLTSEVPSTTAPFNTPEPGESISGRLAAAIQAQGLEHATEVRDAFAPSQAWANDLGLNQSGGTGQQPFQDRHQLMAVVAVDGNSYVVIDDQILRLGHTLDGYTLVKIKERTAVLEADGVRVELEISSER